MQGSCHSDCPRLSCSGATCELSYTGTGPLELFKVKKTNPAGENDRSNIISILIHREQLC